MWQEVKDDKGEITVPASKWIMHATGTIQEIINTEDGDLSLIHISEPTRPY